MAPSDQNPCKLVRVWIYFLNRLSASQSSQLHQLYIMIVISVNSSLQVDRDKGSTDLIEGESALVRHELLIDLLRFGLGEIFHGRHGG
jgi:hypothetical protein